MVSTVLQHCWDEYRDTLHGQKQPNAMGVMEIRRWRATSLSSAFFTEKTLIETPLRTEFYKHLPGILTGLGIIGTFAGLILGLQGFKVSDDAGVVRGSLETLMASVSSAFILSGSAIALAMVVTTIEKFIVNRRYGELERLCGLIDSMFDAGAGEEYLQRLVEASETSATQALQMKESLVTDLKQVLTELTQQQISTMTATSQQLGQSITTSLAEGLTDPLSRISAAVQQVGNNQGEAVNRLLTDVLGNFTQQMQSMFGTQMQGMNEMLVQTANTIHGASQQFEHLAASLQRAGTGAADAMAERLDHALQQMQLRQQQANEQMQAFIEQLKESVAKGQSESADLTMGMMRELNDSTNALIDGLREQAQATAQTHNAQQNATQERMGAFLGQLQESWTKNQAQSAEATRQLVGHLGGSVNETVQALNTQQTKTNERLSGFLENMQQTMAKNQADTNETTQQLVADFGQSLSSTVQTLQEQVLQVQARQSEHIAQLSQSVQQASASMQSSVQRLQQQTQASLDSMGMGADKLHSASTQLADNLVRMKAHSEQLGNMAGQLTGAGLTLNNALQATQQVLQDQQAMREVLGNLVGDLRETIDLAKREASVSKGLVDSLEAASHRLTEAQRTTETYLEGVTDVLGEAHGAFAQQIMATLREGNKSFHEELAHATNLLKGAIQDLGDVLDNLPSAS